MFTLLILLLERISITVCVAFILTRIPFFRKLLNRDRLTSREGACVVVIFGLFGILGTYTGVPVQGESFSGYGFGHVAPEQAIANSRVVGVFIAGLLGGPAVGLGAGLVAGVHRYFLGGFTAFSCGFSTVVEGIIAGFIGQKFGRVHVPGRVAFAAGALAEGLQMLIIITLARPMSQAMELVQLIGLPMIVANAAGITVFVLIIQSVLAEEQRAGALQAHKALQIANRTLSYLRQGLNYRSAGATANIIKQETRVAAVAITDQERILAHVGLGDDHHRPGHLILTGATLRVLESGQLQTARSRDEIACSNPRCQLTSAIIVPLKRQDETLGTLKLYWHKHRINAVDMELARGLAHLFSTQLELARLEEQSRLLARAEIKALQAQVNPHFLFNSLNVIVSLIRQKPDTARRLLVHLGDFFRQNLQSSNQEMVTLEKEIAHIRAYLAIEQARFQEKLQVKFNVEPEVLGILLPPLTLQPLVENAVRHGLQPLAGGGCITVEAGAKPEGVEITVADNGRGMSAEKVSCCLTDDNTCVDNRGIGLCNVHQRLVGLFGRHAGLRIESGPGRGTRVTAVIPAARVLTEVSDIDPRLGGGRRNAVQG